MNAIYPNRIVLHVAGLDRPGITARLTELLAEENAHLIDIGQSVLHGYLMLSAIVDIPPSSNALRKILFAVAELGLRLDVSALPAQEAPTTAAPGLCLTVLGPLANGEAPAKITRFIASRGMNIREIRSLSENELTGLELIADPTTPLGDGKLAELRGELLRMGMELGVDLAVQKDDIFRRSKRLGHDGCRFHVRQRRAHRRARGARRLQRESRGDHRTRHARRDRVPAGAR
jgi:phosphoserine phosphatase